MFISKILFYTILLLISIGKVISLSYTCNIDQNANINPKSPNYCSFSSSSKTGTCLNINDCINSFNSIGNGNIYIIALVNNYYNYQDNNCNLVIKSTSQFQFIPLGINSTIDCQYRGSFIKSSISSMTFTNLIIANTINSAIVSNSSITIPVITVSNMNFINCSSNQDGGALQIHSPNLINVMDSNFRNCSSNSRGGAISSEATLNIHSSIFSLNKANEGGAVYSSQTSIRNVAFIDNKAILGGAISSNELNIQGSTIRNNTAVVGGGIYVQGIQSQLCDFYYNNADEGGAIYIHDTITDSILNQNKIFNNTANINGGALYVRTPDNGKLNLTGSLIFENIANYYGGAIYFNKSSTPFIYSGKIYNNTAYEQVNSTQQELACDRFSHVNCNLCGVQNCNVCQQNQGICIKIKSKNNNNSSGGGGGGGGSSENNNNNSSSNSYNGNSKSSSEYNSSSEFSSENENNNSKITSKDNYINYFEDDYQEYIYSSNNMDHLCLLTIFACDHGKCSLFINSTNNQDYQFKCECQSGFWGPTCEGDSSESLSSSSSQSESYDSSNNSNSNSNSTGPHGDDSSNNSNSKTMLALEVSLPIVLGFLIIVFIVVLYFVLRRRDEVFEISNEDIKPLINESTHDRDNYL